MSNVIFTGKFCPSISSAADLTYEATVSQLMMAAEYYWIVKGDRRKTAEFLSHLLKNAGTTEFTIPVSQGMAEDIASIDREKLYLANSVIQASLEE